ncbi:MAG: helix-hairpin-helix domain-containing protein [Nitrospira sp.]|nr:helix-hairpin-helix domain-containing protein [Nitrospira sp.]
MIRSLAIKLGLLAVTMGLIWWMAWQAPEQMDRPASLPDESTPVAVEASVQSPPLPTTGGVEARLTTTPAQKDRGIEPRSHFVSPTSLRSSGLVDLNRADAKTLESLPGIGAVLARRVLDYRASVGQFRTVEDLLAVRGIGPKTVERIRPFVMISDQGSGDQAGKNLS